MGRPWRGKLPADTELGARGSLDVLGDYLIAVLCIIVGEFLESGSSAVNDGDLDSRLAWKDGRCD